MPKYSFKRQDKRIEPIECESLLIAMPTRELRAVISALYITGARISEVLDLSPKSIRINKKDNTVEITILSLKRRKKTEEPFKTTRVLTFKRSSMFLDYIMDYLPERIGYDKLFSVSRKTVWKYIRKYSDDISPHIFRHSRLQKLADKGATAHQISMFAGHSELNSSLSYIASSKASLQPLKELIE